MGKIFCIGTHLNKNQFEPRSNRRPEQVVLVGDSGERDPIVCAELLRRWDAHTDMVPCCLLSFSGTAPKLVELDITALVNDVRQGVKGPI